jgi:IS605 OrfB family transposase
MKSISDPKKYVESSRLLRTPYDVGIMKNDWKQCEPRVDIDDTNLAQSSDSKHKMKEKSGKRLKKRRKRHEEKSATPESAQPVKRKIWKRRLNSSVVNTQITSACQTLEAASTSNVKGFCPFWTMQSGEISRKLLLPTRTDCVGLDSNSSNECSDLLGGKSWFSIKRCVPPNKNLSGTFSQSLRSLALDSTVYEVTHSDEKLGMRTKPENNENGLKTLQMRFYPSKDEELRLLADCTRWKWYYNACLDIVNTDELKAKIAAAKQEKKLCPSARKDEIRNLLAWHEYKEETQFMKDGKTTLTVCSFEFNEQCREEQVRKARIKVEQMVNQEAQHAFNKIQTKFLNTMESYLSKTDKTIFKTELKAARDLKKEMGKELAKEAKRRNGLLPKTVRKYPCPKWMDSCYGQQVSGKTHERIIRGACGNFCSNLNSATTNLYRERIQDFTFNRKRDKDIHEILSFDDGNYPTYLRTLTGSYSYRLPPQYAKQHNVKKRSTITIAELLKIHREKPITIIYDKRTKEWLLNLPVDQNWYPPHDVRSENQGSQLPTGEAVGVDPGMRKFLTGYSTQGEVFTVGDRSCSRLVNMIIMISKRASKLAKLRKIKTLSQAERDLQRQLSKEKDILWLKLKNLVKELHWKSAHFLVKNYKYIFLEDFSTHSCLKSQTTKPMVKRILQQYSFYQFKLRLAYLCKKYSRKLILVHPALTTKGCSNCGALNYTGDSETYTCRNCSFITDRDYNSGKNVMVKGMTILFR